MKNKKCNRCNRVKSLSEFYRNKKYKDNFTTWCRECFCDYHKEHGREYYQSEKGQLAYKKYRRSDGYKKVQRKSKLKYYYGITLIEYDQMFEDQNGVCAVCGNMNDSGQRLSIDHDHKTGKIRGLLCHRCNVALGYAKDSVDLLEKLIKYLK